MGEHEVRSSVVQSVGTGAGKRRGILLDRDGTLIDIVREEELGVISVAFHPDQLVILPGVVEGLRALASAGFVLAMATNQPAPAKGQFSAAAVKRTNDALVELLAREGVVIAAVKACMHHPDGGPRGDASLVGPCDCRKPLPGMLNQLVDELDLDRAGTWMIGDSAGDVEAGAAAGVRTGLIFSSNRCELCPLRPGVSALTGKRSPDVHGSTLAKVAEAILARAPIAPSSASAP